MEKVGKKKNKSLWEKINAFAHPPLSFANQVENVMNAYPSIFLLLIYRFNYLNLLFFRTFFLLALRNGNPKQTLYIQNP